MGKGQEEGIISPGILIHYPVTPKRVKASGNQVAVFGHAISHASRCWL
jgi:hypothetical protein